MAIMDLWSKRNSSKLVPDVFQYTNFPKEFRVQVIHLWDESFGPYKPGSYAYNHNNDSWNLVEKILVREYGMFSLGTERTSYERIISFFLNCDDEKRILDVIQITFRIIEFYADKDEYQLKDVGITVHPNAAIKELNERFKEHNLGFQFEGRDIIKIDHTFTHTEIIKPALQLLHNKKFKGAEEEFRKSFEHYKSGNQKEALQEALKAFESTLKTICDLNKWTYAHNATSNGLIEVVIKNQLLPTRHTAHFTGLRQTLEAGIPTISNANGRHGQGKDPIRVPDYMVSYALELTSSAIKLLINAHEKISSQH